MYLYRDYFKFKVQVYIIWGTWTLREVVLWYCLRRRRTESIVAFPACCHTSAFDKVQKSKIEGFNTFRSVKKSATGGVNLPELLVREAPRCEGKQKGRLKELGVRRASELFQTSLNRLQPLLGKRLAPKPLGQKQQKAISKLRAYRRSS